MGLHVIAVTETESHLRWAAGLIGQLPAGTRVDMLQVAAPTRPSPIRRDAALVGTPFHGRTLEVVSPEQLLRRVAVDRPDAVLLACAGPAGHPFQEALGRAEHRPVLVSGTPGIALPARRQVWGHRGAVDLLVVHSRREVAEYDLVRGPLDKTGRIGLATLPFLRVGPRAVSGGDAVVFAAQGRVPRGRTDRLAVLCALDRLAGTRPDLEILVKTRGDHPDRPTRYEHHDYGDLVRGMARAGRLRHPERIRVVDGPLAEHLDRAAGFVTVSSTAALEAMARRVPLLVVDGFEADPRTANEVFVGSGCLGGLGALARGEFRHPDRGWMDRNYFHPAAENTWVSDLQQLGEQVAVNRAPSPATGAHPSRSPGRRRRDRIRFVTTDVAVPGLR
jgi:hypothetical protein